MHQMNVMLENFLIEVKNLSKLVWIWTEGGKMSELTGGLVWLKLCVFIAVCNICLVGEKRMNWHGLK